ncbi:MAG: Excinuclease ABC C subunit domain protein [Candidatus Woesebacteria bacterium GW2011_GWC2_33_12]|uniref:Excinuclease ABC C subunit domain protein n=1 Tax=Candidatus Woesebacteria bacterium GW2011_GWB1_33_22 TaxID=1618566 RepID=A0A0G0CNK7_9BACT|nr:MAG: Excinuclease ABC C subunit domain protein [Candidatus Woesebacteria bacterium GW2011_GWC2_33_12]KKP42261.1 MAG: Excinuclease ABC C subunit domain protein [Candidatus Woesebacteria bacterium GW2011_GWA2_33_20]KKP44992.1 MAG: Excinuclease ABC C subunit domain protein [Candidatus Woesebacteria bacterium GW2011_GWB1_33_22]KKP46841.1 MAG: Excinuclease ABC C subunit domain protein [Microgenomates group bacterium GW2011_GWC1_33_28]KKP50713.1 MAG: Excinuclease ABC C subunit domain protein [Cand
MVEEADKITFIQVTSDLESLLLESYLIKTWKPKYNILLKDDKHALYIVITKEEFPRVLAVRKLYAIPYNLYASFGPFPNSTNVKTILKLIRRVFPFSDHKLAKKPCLYSHLGLCNPCPNTAINNILYKQNIRNIKLILSRKFNTLRKLLEKEMNALSKLERYEEAKLIRDKIQALDYITQGRIQTESFIKNPNLTQDIRNEELENLSKLINIKKLRRIECFDVAHLSGSSATASMIVFIDGVAEKSEYKHFKIRQLKGQSDYDSMREVAIRRIKHLNDWGKPNLIIVDGGLGQVKIFDKEFKKIKIPVVGIAKNPDRLVFVNGNKIKLQGLTLQLISRIRDEAHRFARRYHHLLVTKNLLS